MQSGRSSVSGAARTSAPQWRTNSVYEIQDIGMLRLVTPELFDGMFTNRHGGR